MAGAAKACRTAISVCFSSFVYAFVETCAHRGTHWNRRERGGSVRGLKRPGVNFFQDFICAIGYSNISPYGNILIVFEIREDTHQAKENNNKYTITLNKCLILHLNAI